MTNTITHPTTDLFIGFEKDLINDVKQRGIKKASITISKYETYTSLSYTNESGFTFEQRYDISKDLRVVAKLQSLGVEIEFLGMIEKASTLNVKTATKKTPKKELQSYGCYNLELTKAIHKNCPHIIVTMASPNWRLAYNKKDYQKLVFEQYGIKVEIDKIIKA